MGPRLRNAGIAAHTYSWHFVTSILSSKLPCPFPHLQPRRRSATTSISTTPPPRELVCLGPGVRIAREKDKGEKRRVPRRHPHNCCDPKEGSPNESMHRRLVHYMFSTRTQVHFDNSSHCTVFKQVVYFFGNIFSVRHSVVYRSIKNVWTEF